MRTPYHSCLHDVTYPFISTVHELKYAPHASPPPHEKYQQVAPGKRSPTVSQLDTEGWFAVQSLILKKDSSRVMDDLQGAGAKDILLFALHNTRINTSS